MNIQIFPSIDGEWGEVHDHILKDAVTQALWELSNYGGIVAMRNIPALDKLIEGKSWRAVDAADAKAMITRVALAEQPEQEAVPV